MGTLIDLEKELRECDRTDNEFRKQVILSGLFNTVEEVDKAAKELNFTELLLMVTLHCKAVTEYNLRFFSDKLRSD